MTGATDVANPGDAIQDIELALEQEEQHEEDLDSRLETRRRMERAKSRGLGTMELTVNYPRPGRDAEEVPFARLSIAEADDILDRLEELQTDDQATRRDMREFVTGTLEEYCLDPERDEDHWANELTYGDGVGLVRNIAFGGNPPAK